MMKGGASCGNSSRPRTGRLRAMYTVATNITTRDSRVNLLFRRLKARGSSEEAAGREILQELARRCAGAGADAIEINLQQHHDRPKNMEFAVTAVQSAVSCQICLSTDNRDTLEAGVNACSRPPIFNYVSMDEERLGALSLLARRGAGVVLLVSDPSSPSDAQDMLARCSVLLGAAREAGIPDGNILIDPGLLHVTTDLGQRHMAEVMKFLPAVPEAFGSEVRSTCWISNASVGIARRLRPVVDVAVLTSLAVVGLSSAFVDVLRRENMRAMRLSRILMNDSIYSEKDLEP